MATRTAPFSRIEAPLEKLQTQLQGEVVIPGDARYDTARQAWNLTIQQAPAVIVMARSTQDVVAAVRFARSMGLGVAVQATGHGVVQPANDCLLINTAQMVDVQVDAEAQTAWISAGTKWGVVLEKAQAVGLAPLLGSSTDVGAIGYTLGGGIGWLARKYGLSADSVNYFELVTADGQLQCASPTENPDLFWGLRGGGGSFGVITGMEVKLYPVTTVYAGSLVYPVSVAKEVVQHYGQWIATVPEEMTTSIALMNLPPIPEVPEFLRGQSVVMVRGCYVGAMEDGEALLNFWREWMPPMADMFGPMPFSQANAISDEPVDPMAGFSTMVWLRDFNDEVIDTLVEYGLRKDGLMMTEVRHVGSPVISQVDTTSSAYGCRKESLVLHMLSIAPTPEAFHHLELYSQNFKAALAPHLSQRVYMNFLDGKEKHERTPDAYAPATYQRLMALKAEYDPENLFRFSFNIPPKNA